jgi:sorting nexin-29
VHSFAYLGSEVNCKNDIRAEIIKRILSANRCFYELRKHFKSQLISRKTKLTCASKTWTLTKADDRALGLFERMILRSIFGAVEEI